MTKLTHMAHPKGWEKGCPVEVRGLQVWRSSDLELLSPVGPAQVGNVEFLGFTNAEHRDQWLKWWRKK